MIAIVYGFVVFLTVVISKVVFRVFDVRGPWSHIATTALALLAILVVYSIHRSLRPTVR